MQIQQGGSVMCDGALGSDSAHPQFWLNCLPNEEQMEKPNNYFIFWEVFFKKTVYER